MRNSTGEGEPSMPDLLGGSFSGESGTGGRSSAGMAVVSAARGKVADRDQRVRGDTGSPGSTGGGGGDAGDRGFGRNPYGPVQRY